MKIAIQKNLGGFSEHWIEYCQERDIEYKLLNCYSNSIIKDIEDCDIIMLHPLQLDYKAEIFFKQLIFALSKLEKKIFPNINTIWHFDDKIGQKYLLESIGAPFVQTYIFYSKAEAMEWINTTSFPKVFKLRAGAGSNNVRLVQSKNEAKKLVSRAFRNGFPKYSRWASLKERIRKHNVGLGCKKEILKGIFRLFWAQKYVRYSSRESGYIYFQDFIPDNRYDIRVCVIGNKAFAIKRMCRKDDFRASGSGYIIYDKEQIDLRCLELAFSVNNRIEAQSLAFDFVFDQERNPLILEISYGFRPSGYYDCPGYWDSDLTWHEGKFNPYGWMIENLQ